MVWPVPTVPELAVYVGRPETSFTGYATSALLQATLMFTTLSERTADDYNTIGSDVGMAVADAQLLANSGIMALADWIYLRWPYAQVIANPLQDESIGSYHWSKPIQEMARNAQALEVNAEKTGVEMFDLAMRTLAKRSRANGVFYGQITGFEHYARDDAAEIKWDKKEGRLALVGPADKDKIDFQFFDINAGVFPLDPA